ncbi:MAG: DUF1571 domain-containing protein [Pirellulaceae bacterium]
MYLIRILVLTAVIGGPAALPLMLAFAQQPATKSPHPLEPVLKMAERRLEFIDEEVRDYTCTIIKRERVNGQLGESQFMFAKVRHAGRRNGEMVPFSVYLRFLKPKAVEGREVIWIEGRNANKLVAHETGLLNFKRAWLDPTGYLAMMGQRYPISEIGMRNLIEELLKKGERERQFAESEVKEVEGAKVNGRVCKMIQVIHPVQRPHFEFYKAQIFIDNELQLPIRYASWTWPTEPNGEPVLEEEYTYTDVKVNVGLTDEDFSPDNSAYNFPSL